MISKREPLVALKENDWDVLLTIGAGDIDLFVSEIENMLNEVDS